MTSFTWWFILLISCILLELSSPGLFFFLSFSLGAAAAALLSYYDIGTGVEFALFMAVSALSFLLLTNYVKGSKDTLHSTNVYALLGKKGMVFETIADCKKGWVKVEGEMWAAASLDGKLIEEGAHIEVVSTAGSHVVVRKIEGHC